MKERANRLHSFLQSQQVDVDEQSKGCTYSVSSQRDLHRCSTEIKQGHETE